MTPTEILKRECEEITQKTGVYVPPYRLANLLKNAGKIFEMLIKADTSVSYTECLLTLRVVMNAIKEITGEDT